MSGHDGRIRIAAVGDLHYGAGMTGKFRDAFARVETDADLLLLAGDLTRTGRVEEISGLIDDLEGCGIPTFAVLGNHEYQSGQEERLVESLDAAGVRVLEGNGTVIEVNGRRIGVAGIKGFGGGFMGACGSEFGEPEMKLFARHSREQGERLHRAIESLDAGLRIVLLHFSPIEQTLAGERREIFPFLGSYHLAEPLDAFQVDLAVHGHAHRGVEHGMTPGGVPVRNVAFPVIREPYRVYSLEERAGAVVKERAWATLPESTTS